MKKDKCTAVIAAAGSGRRMGGTVSKQYIELKGKPILAHTLLVFQNSDIIDDIILVVGKDSAEQVREEITEAFGITKVSRVIPGGDERYSSVYRGLLECEDADYVFIQDGVRPFVTDEILRRGYAMAREFGSAVCGMPSKDTVKIADEDGVVVSTPDRSRVWTVQTPQIFSYDLIRRAYDSLLSADPSGITDDAMVLEQNGFPVHMFEGSYRNIKITTPEDLAIAEKFLESAEEAAGKSAEEAAGKKN